MHEFDAIGLRLGLGAVTGEPTPLFSTVNLITRVPFTAGDYVVKVQDPHAKAIDTLSRYRPHERLEWLAYKRSVPMATPVIDPLTGMINFIDGSGDGARLVSVREWLNGTPLHAEAPFRSKQTVEALGRTMGGLADVSREFPVEAPARLQKSLVREVEVSPYNRNAGAPGLVPLVEAAPAIAELQRQTFERAAGRPWHFSNDDVFLNCLVQPGSVKIFDWDLSGAVMLEQAALVYGLNHLDVTQPNIDRLMRGYWQHYRAAGGQLEPVITYLPVREHMQLLGTVSKILAGSERAPSPEEASVLVDRVHTAIDSPDLVTSPGLITARNAIEASIRVDRSTMGR